MPRFEFKDGASNEFWEISIHGNAVTVKYGKIGTAGQQQLKSFASDAEAQKEYDSLISQKTKKGYMLVSQEPGHNAAATDEALTRDEFWALIDSSRRGTEDADEQVEKLKDMLANLSEEAILDFDRHMREVENEAYRWDLWGAAYIINGGCSDDGFDYFIGWLISQGRRYFEAALADPNNAGNKAEPGDFVECESIMYAASYAYEKKTGNDDFHSRTKPMPRELKGEEWDEDHVDELFPKLAKKFNAAV